MMVNIRHMEQDNCIALNKLTISLSYFLTILAIALFFSLPVLSSPAHAAVGDFLFKLASPGTDDGQLNHPSGIAVDVSGNVYVVDRGNHRIQIFSNTGTFLRKWGTEGSGDGQFSFADGIAVDSSGNVYVADTNNHRVQVFSNTGTFLRKWGTYGPGDGQFNYPYGIAVDESGAVYIADYYNHRVQVFSNTGTYLRQWGGYGYGDGQFAYPRGIAVDGRGDVYIADYYNHRVQVFSNTGTYLRQWGGYGSNDGQFCWPFGIAVDGSGNVYVANSYNVQVFSSTGTFRGRWGTYGSGDGQFMYPAFMAVSGRGYVYVVDFDESYVQVFEGYSSTDIQVPVTTYMISGTAGSNGWYVSNVTIKLTATDSGSGVKEIHYSVDDGAEVVVTGSFASVSLTTDGNHTVSYYAVDNAANSEAAHSVTVNIDKTAPTIVAIVNPTSNANGWNNTDITVTFVCADATSGVAICTAPITVSAEGANQVIIGTAVDNAGNSASTSVTLNIDKTSPSVNITATPNILWPPNHKMVNVLVEGSASDAGSDVASVLIVVTDEYGIYNMTVPGFGSTIQLEASRKGKDKDGRLYTITAVVTDKSGNQSTAITTVLVPHDKGDEHGDD